MKILLSILTLCSLLKAEYNLLEESQVKDKEGNIFYILNYCKDGKQYTAIHKTESLSFIIAQDFIKDIETGKLEEIPCQNDFKSEEQLREINEGRR